jgi:hypothetical protein
VDNFGSLAFSRAAHVERVSLEEVIAQLPQSGFADFQARENTMPYMRSPASRHARIECTVAWLAKQGGITRRVAARTARPGLAAERRQTVPRSRAFEMQAISSRCMHSCWR